MKLLFHASAKVDTQDLDYIFPLQYLFGNVVGGVFWKPIWNVLEGEMELLLVNAQHIKAVPGRK